MFDELWEIWSDSHDSPDQKKRIESAKKSSCTPPYVDFTEGIGKFQGSSGNHTTTLQQCSCIDFNRRKLPCKHMYRLAMELGCMEADFQSNLDDVAAPQTKKRITKMKTEEVIASIEKLSNDAQITLLDIARNTNSKSPYIAIAKDNSFAELQKNGFLEIGSDDDALLKCYKRSEINQRLQTLDIPFDKKMKLATLRKWCIENIPTHIDELFNDFAVVRINPKMGRQSIHYYLHRKYDCVPCVSETGEEIVIPLLETELPDDEITMFLKKYGYYQ